MGWHPRQTRFLGALLLAALVGLPPAVLAQGAGGPAIRDSNVNYIDTAIPGTLFRLRYESASNNRRPTRAEFFWPQGGRFNPGPDLPEASVDYQDLTGYLEAAVSERLSGFVELPVRFLNPEINDNTSGLGDLNAGFKYAFLHCPDRVATFQLRTYLPTGDGDRGRGTDHVSLEPGLLLFQRLDERLTFEGELRYWVPLGGTEFAGSIVRYGAGLHYDLGRVGPFRLVPVAEAVGWTALAGKATARHPSGAVTVEDAAGNTIVNLKLGLRVKLGDRGDLAPSVGRPLTGDRWYETVYRLEFRLFF